MRVPRFGLTTRIFLSSAGTVLVVLGITLALTQMSAQKAAQTSITRQLDAAVERVQELVTSERAQLAGRTRAYADNPLYRANIESRDPEYFDYAVVAAEQTAARWVQLISREGVRLAKSDDPGARPDTLLQSPLIRRALDGEVAQAFGVAGDSSLIEVVAVPIEGGGRRIIGALMATKTVSDSITRAVGAQTQSEIFFYALDSRRSPHFVAATDALRPSAGALLATLAPRLSADSVSDVQLAGGEADSAGSSGTELDQVELNGEHFVSRRAHMLSAAGAPVGGFLAMRSLESQPCASSGRATSSGAAVARFACWPGLPWYQPR